MSLLSSTSLPWYRALRGPRSATPGLPPCIHVAFADAARARPERALLVDDDRCLAQGELHDAVHRYARRLLEHAGGADRTVAVRLDPGIDSVIAYFACLAAGLRYLPLPAGPVLWTRRLLRLLPAQLLVTRRELVSGDAGIETLLVDPNAADHPAVVLPQSDPRRIAHVLLTSGTETGTPKAVLTDHVGSMLSHEWRARLWPDDPPRDVVGCNLFGTWDAVPALCRGIPVVMIGDATFRDPPALASSIVRYGITRLMLTPTLLDACLADEEGSDALGRLRRIVLCGEPVTAAMASRARDALPGVELGNLYSLSECHDVAGGDLTQDGRVTAGRVAEFAAVHVTDVDDVARLLPAGEPGRVLIGGEALAAGYLDPELTTRRFFEASFGGDAPRRVYDSGDLGVLHEDGRLEILGRVDDTVKVRGAWAEPESVACLLRRHPQVARAAVMAETDARGRTQLSAFAVAAGTPGPSLAASLRGWLAERMGPHSLPARLAVVDDLPLSPSGKVDLRRFRDAGRHDAAAKPPGSTAQAVLDTFRDVLDAPDAGFDDDLESLGADSLSLIVLGGELRRRTGRGVRIGDLRRHATARALARRLEQRARRAPRSGWRLPDLDLDTAAAPSAPRREAVRRVLVTGATGALGRALIGRLLGDTDLEVAALVRAPGVEDARRRLAARVAPGFGAARLEPVAGDLVLPCFGLASEAFGRLAAETDAVLHVGADLDMFADYAMLEAVNVGGTREVLRLAFEGGARLYHVSSSAVLPLDPERVWDEDSSGFELMASLAPELARSDGYSRSKLAAEALVWLAAERGLAVTVARLPHLAGGGLDTRLSATLRVLAAAGVLPEGDWQWQVAPIDAACARLVSLLACDGPVRLEHLTAMPLSAADVAGALRARGAGARTLPLPAVVSVLARARFADERATRALSALNQLIAEHGARAALSLADARLASRHPLNGEPGAVLDCLLPGPED